ncbi:hypothetical protein QVD17_34485 [Tagetes erecta]|uniref:Uncharacterized protein n=1 Tax=Tagetes erecta TaxID=13708 RepID=A0AAD8JYK2_TARER|nr:hypothetical protein QVD17_34485 [Tagetes erecta]
MRRPRILRTRMQLQKPGSVRYNPTVKHSPVGHQRPQVWIALLLQSNQYIFSSSSVESGPFSRPLNGSAASTTLNRSEPHLDVALVQRPIQTPPPSDRFRGSDRSEAIQ